MTWGRGAFAVGLALVVAACGDAGGESPATVPPTLPAPAVTATLPPPPTTAAAQPPQSVATTVPPTSPPATPGTSTVPPATTTVLAAAATSLPPPTTQAAAPAPANVVPISLRLDRRVSDPETEHFAAIVRDTLTDPRGWQQAGFVFSFPEEGAAYTVVLAEGPEVDELCAPYRTGGRFSCQIGPLVALNADRWRSAVESWPDTLAAYQTMLVNHEVGHLLGQHHPAGFCSGPGQPAAVMAQQSKGVGECTANWWPLPWEIGCASLHEEPLAPPYEVDIVLTCGPERGIASLVGG